MKVIDLLNKIANGERPERIKYKDKVYNWNKNVGNYILEYDENVSINWDFVSMLGLDSEVEIIEEDKKIYKLDWVEGNTFNKIQENSYLSRKEIQLLDSNFKELGNKINEIIEYLEENK